MQITIMVEVDSEDFYADPEHKMGITNDAYERLTGYTEAWGAGALNWLGEVQSVELTDRTEPDTMQGVRKEKPGLIPRLIGPEGDEQLQLFDPDKA